MPYEHNLHESFEHLCFITDAELDEATIRRKLESLKDGTYGEINRVKGILNAGLNFNLRVDMAGSIIDVKKSTYCGIGRICFIGFNLNRIRIRELFSIGKI